MKRLKGFMWAGALLAAALIAAPAQAAEWGTDYDKALAAAKKDGKLVLVDFTGSDWCGWCIRLKKEVFSKPEFAAWAKKNVVLLELDFPKAKKQSAEIKARNKKLAEKYGVRGFPTILFLDPAGKVVGRSGYKPGGPKAWTADADSIIEAGKPKPMAWAEGAEAAMKTAKEKKTPLLVAVDGGKLGELDQSFIDMANLRLTSVKGTADQIGALLKGAGVAADPGRVAVIDVSGDKPKLLAAGMAGDSGLGDKIAAALPKIAYDGAWLTNFAQAKAIASSHKKPIMLDFTGSDWCGWCIKLDNEVFTKDEFKKYAKENLVLVKLDFPKSKPQDAAIKQQNRALAQEYGVRGFPTIIVLDAGASKIGQLGYMPGGPAAFIAATDKVIKK